MKLQKGKFYKVNDYYDHMKHHAAEYHSTEIIKNNGKKIHNMIIRMIDDDYLWPALTMKTSLNNYQMIQNYR